jgi:hypothetical protein
METKEQKQLKEISVMAAKKIPYVGEVAGGLIKVLWVIKEPTLWDQIKNQVAEFVEKAIVEERLNILQKRLKGYQTTVEFISTLEGKTQYDELKSFQLILETDRPLFYDTSGNSNTLRQTLPLFTPMTVIHIMISNLVVTLSEQYDSYQNTNAFNNKYESLKHEYATYGYNSVVTARQWRIDQIEITSVNKTSSFSGGSITTTELKCIDKFEKKTIHNKTYFTDPIGLFSDTRMVNNYKKDITNKTTEYWENTVLSVIRPWDENAVKYIK